MATPVQNVIVLKKLLIKRTALCFLRTTSLIRAFSHILEGGQRMIRIVNINGRLMNHPNMTESIASTSSSMSKHIASVLTENIQTVISQRLFSLYPVLQHDIGVCQMEKRRCWKCDRLNGNREELFFCHCGIIQKVPTDVNYFDVFGIEPNFKVELEKLSIDYKKYQLLLHPDKFVNKTKNERILSDELSSLVNNAYKTLQKPLARGLYLLELKGDPLEEGTPSMDYDFLTEIMEINEKVASAETEVEAKKIWCKNSAVLDELLKKVTNAFLVNDVAEAKALLTRMKYFTNIEDKLKESQLRQGWVFDE